MRTHKKDLLWLIMLPFLFAACSPQPPAEPAAPATAAPAAKPYGNLLQMMRAIPFPNSNVIFDTQTTDPEVKLTTDKANAEKGIGNKYDGTYGGWAGVEESAVALGETVNLLMLPGRLCSNGLPVPVDREDYQKFAQQLADAAAATQKAAQSKSMDAMVEVAGTVAEACAACHEVYRDQPEPKQRCTP